MKITKVLILVLAFLLITLGSKNIVSESDLRFVMDESMVSSQKNPLEESIHKISFFVSHSVVVVTSDVGPNGFIANGFTGGGTFSNPYVLQGKNITSSSSTLVSISGTTAYFRIANNYLNGNSNLWTGIDLQNVGNGILINNTILSCGQGIELWNSDNNTIVNNTISFNNYNGIKLLNYSNNNTIFNNTIHNSFQESGIWLDSSSENNISANIVYNSDDDGIRLLSSSNNNFVHNNTVYNSNWVGIRLQSSNTLNIISNNIVHNNNEYGISIEGPTPSNNNTVTHNTIHDNNVGGIGVFQGSAHNLIFNNTVYDNFMWGFDMGTSTNNNKLINNTINNCRYGINLWDTQNNTIANNSLTNNGIYIGGPNLASYLQLLIVNNSVNDKPLIYWRDRTSGTVPKNVGQIILFNCTDLIIADQKLSNNSIGVLTAYSSNLTIHNNTIFNTIWGFFIDKFTNITTLSNNTAYNNIGDIQFWRAHNNLVINNTLGNNSNYGLVLDTAENNVITNNTVFKTNLIGIWGWGSNNKNNTISHNIISNNLKYGISIADGSSDTIVNFNNFIGNNIGGSQAMDNGTNSVFEYNHWTNWISPDTNSDGIVDVPYSIEGIAYNQDQFPLVSSPITHYILRPVIHFPSGGELLSGTTTVSWTIAVDTWGYNISYNVSYSSDGGATWILLEGDMTTSNYIWDTLTVPDGLNYLIEVKAISSRGLEVASISTGPFTIDNTPPTITILSPTMQKYTSDTIIVTLSGNADDYWYYIEPIDTQNQTWRTSTDRTLADGTYTLHAYGVDSAGNIGYTSIAFTIEILVTTSTTTPITTPTTSVTITPSWSVLLLLFTLIAIIPLKRRSKRI